MSKVDIHKPGWATIAAVVPAFNEEKSIRRTIHAIRSIPELDEFIVVSDGSEDRTAEIVLEETGVDLVDLKQNVGKGGALRAGLNAAKSNVILLLDADLIGFTREHAALLLNPVLEGKAKTTCGVFREGRVATDLAQVIAPMLSGQRVFLRDVLDGAPIEDTRYGVEIAINRHFEENKIDIHYVDLYNLGQQMKEEKFGFMRGMAARAGMYYDVVKILFVGNPK